MAFDIGKAFKVATIPIVIMIVWALIQTFIGFAVNMFPPIGYALCVLAPIGLLLGVVIPAWAGFKAVKEAQMDIVGGAITGGLVGLVASIVGAVLTMIVSVLDIGAFVATSGMSPEYALAGAGGLIGLAFSLVAGIVFWTVVAVVLGAIGAFIAKNMKK